MFFSFVPPPDINLHYYNRNFANLSIKSFIFYIINKFKIIVNNDEAGIEESLSYEWHAFGQSAALGAIETITITPKDEPKDECTFSEDIEIFYVQVIITVEKGKTETNQAFEVFTFESNLVSLEDMV